MRRAGRARAAMALTLLLALLLTGVRRAAPAASTSAGAPTGSPSSVRHRRPPRRRRGSASGSAERGEPHRAAERRRRTTDGSYAVPDPGRAEPPLLTPDVLVTSSQTDPRRGARGRRDVTGVRGRAAAVAGVAVGRRAHPQQSLPRTPALPALHPVRSRAVPTRSGPASPAARSPSTRRCPASSSRPQGYLRLGTSADAPDVHIGAYAPLVQSRSRRSSTIKRGEQLGIPRDNALLISTGLLTPSEVTEELKKAARPRRARCRPWRWSSTSTCLQTAVLSGSSVSDAVGTFSYTPHANGTVTPQPSWVNELHPHREGADPRAASPATRGCCRSCARR